MAVRGRFQGFDALSGFSWSVMTSAHLLFDQCVPEATGRLCLVSQTVDQGFDFALGL